MNNNWTSHLVRRHALAAMMAIATSIFGAPAQAAFPDRIKLVFE